MTNTQDSGWYEVPITIGGVETCLRFKHPEPHDFDNDTGYTCPAAWRNLKQSLGRDYDIAESMLALETLAGNGCVRLIMSVALDWFVWLRDERDVALANFQPTLARLASDCIRRPHEPYPDDFGNDRRYARPASWRRIGPGIFGRCFDQTVAELEGIARESEQCPRVLFAAALHTFVRMPELDHTIAWQVHWLRAEEGNGREHYAIRCRQRIEQLMLVRATALYGGGRVRAGGP
jgi:hypothetical protein